MCVYTYIHTHTYINVTATQLFVFTDRLHHSLIANICKIIGYIDTQNADKATNHWTTTYRQT